MKDVLVAKHRYRRRTVYREPFIQILSLWEAHSEAKITRSLCPGGVS